MKRALVVLIIALILGAAIVGFAFIVRHTADTATANKHRVDQLAQILTNQQEELTILRNATDPAKQAAALKSFFVALRQELQKDVGQLRVAVEQTSPVVRTVVVTRTVCRRPNGHPC